MFNKYTKEFGGWVEAFPELFFTLVQEVSFIICFKFYLYIFACYFKIKLLGKA